MCTFWLNISSSKAQIILATLKEKETHYKRHILHQRVSSHSVFGVQTEESCQAALNVHVWLLQNKTPAAMEEKARPEVILLIKQIIKK